MRYYPGIKNVVPEQPKKQITSILPKAREEAERTSYTEYEVDA
jgi:hypothetical protein